MNGYQVKVSVLDDYHYTLRRSLISSESIYVVSHEWPGGCFDYPK